MIDPDIWYATGLVAGVGAIVCYIAIALGGK